MKGCCQALPTVSLNVLMLNTMSKHGNASIVADDYDDKADSDHVSVVTDDDGDKEGSDLASAYTPLILPPWTVASTPRIRSASNKSAPLRGVEHCKSTVSSSNVSGAVNLNTRSQQVLTEPKSLLWLLLPRTPMQRRPTVG